MKVRINTIGKKKHTLVKENTPCCHKIRQECGFTQKASSKCVFFYQWCLSGLSSQHYVSMIFVKQCWYKNAHLAKVWFDFLLPNAIFFTLAF